MKADRSFDISRPAWRNAKKGLLQKEVRYEELKFKGNLGNI
jgi:hypothetical protein